MKIPLLSQVGQEYAPDSKVQQERQRWHGYRSKIKSTSMVKWIVPFSSTVGGMVKPWLVRNRLRKNPAEPLLSDGSWIIMRHPLPFVRGILMDVERYSSWLPGIQNIHSADAPSAPIRRIQCMVRYKTIRIPHATVEVHRAPDGVLIRAWAKTIRACTIRCYLQHTGMSTCQLKIDVSPENLDQLPKNWRQELIRFSHNLGEQVRQRADRLTWAPKGSKERPNALLMECTSDQPALEKTLVRAITPFE